ncbi:peptide ABC transporter substrate-binding protein [Mammaliicoccus lentus]|uniref:peptide ABC transporter substrate-binding protein n=1 Tax=Mammaliicoccus lentus TaxID=42858 RepID=UPI002A5A3B43|nr:peptide ABC transporter substrate-binding protein [Mammaliicoccus lentus]WQL55637.1 peptide ABC transporter substrate-binding protein [Mammaliicoccus lentus]
MNNFYKMGIYVLGLVIFLAGCSGTDAGKKEPKDTLRLIAPSDLTTLDSSLAVEAGAFEVMNATQEGLYRLDKDDKAEPAIAKGDPKKSNNGRTWTFDLRKDAKWSNGEPVTAHDFVYAWRRAVDPETAAEYAYIMYDIKNAEAINKSEKKVEELGVKAIDDHTLELTLNEELPYYKELLTFGTFMPLNEKFVKKQGSKYGTSVDKTLYSGPFVMKSWKVEDNYKLKKNKEYWDKDNVALKGIDYSVIKDEQTALNLYNNDKVDTTELSSQNVNSNKDKEGFDTKLESATYYIQINTQTNKDLQNKDLRAAIAQAIDKKAYVNNNLNDGSAPIDTFTPKEVFTNDEKQDYNKLVNPPYSYDVKKAQASLEKAKKDLGKDKINIEFLTFDQDNAKRDAEYFKEQVEKHLPGVTMSIKQQPNKQKIALTKKGDYDVALTGWGPDYPEPMTFLDLFLSETTKGETGYNNPKYDKIINDGKTTLLKDPDKRWDELANAEEMLLEDAMVIPLYQKGKARLTKKEVNGRIIHYVGTKEYKHVKLDR